VERAAPGIAALLEGSTEDGTLSVLDLGSASESSFQLYAGFARRIRFADILANPPPTEGLAGTLEALGSHRLPLYDLVLAWNVLDWLRDEERRALIERLVQVTTPEARLYVLVDASGRPRTCPLRFSLLGRNRVSQEPVGLEEPARPEILPAELERLLMPFRVCHAFTLRGGWREYVAVKEG
jgi:hypothetical protein